MIENLARRLWNRLRRARHPSRCPVSVPPAETDRPLGCGWFDSSHELQRGLLVREHAGVDALGTELPLNAWLALRLAGEGRSMAAGGAARGQA